MFRTNSQKNAAVTVFESWELILFEKLKRIGYIPEWQLNAVYMDFSSAYVPRAMAIAYLDEQIRDMQAQIAEQSRGKSA